MEKLEILRKSDKGILDKLKTNSARSKINTNEILLELDAKTKDKRWQILLPILAFAWCFKGFRRVDFSLTPNSEVLSTFSLVWTSNRMVLSCSAN